MDHRQRVTAIVLTYAGTLPLIALMVGVLAGWLPVWHASRMAMLYGAAIVAFLAGIHWACHLFYAAKCPRNLLLTSNMVALLAWISLLSPLSIWPMLLQVLCFLYLLVLDHRLLSAGILQAWFYALRRNATFIVVSTLSVMMVAA